MTFAIIALVFATYAASTTQSALYMAHVRNLNGLRKAHHLTGFLRLLTILFVLIAIVTEIV